MLLFGIVFSLIARTGFILLGATLINSFAWVFSLLGLRRRHAIAYLDVETDPAIREDIFTHLLAEEAKITTLPEKYPGPDPGTGKLMALLNRAHAEHGSSLAG